MAQFGIIESSLFWSKLDPNSTFLFFFACDFKKLNGISAKMANHLNDDMMKIKIPF